MAPDSDGWSEWGRHIRAELERQSKAMETLDAQIDRLMVDVAELRVRPSLWGAVMGGLAGLVAVLVAIGMKYLGR